MALVTLKCYFQGTNGEDGQVAIYKCIFRSNEVKKTGGGALFMVGGNSGMSVAVNTSTFDSNTAGGSGGGLASQGLNSLKTQDTKFVANTAGEFGGGLSLEVSVCTSVFSEHDC